MARHSLLVTSSCLLPRSYLIFHFAGVVALPLLLRNFKVGDKEADANEIRMAKAAMAEVAIVSLNKMQERLSADVDENSIQKISVKSLPA